ncbi:excalibur calcium-binding domain-containing protein [Kocuria sp. SM24M-10]|uniref:excalibur calcium-binding domain-containing protein n=1 Tax=Kocuria sp. SM24M-10 TaxID=1660349 RepID=UPI0009E25A81
MKRVLDTCDGQTLPKDDGTVSGDADALDTTPVPVARERETEKDVEQPKTKQSPFANCSEAAAAGRYNITTRDPGYNADLDRDGDGVACENAAGAPAPAAPKPAAPVPVAPQPVAPVAPKPVAPQPAAPAPAAGAPYANCTEVYANGESHLTPAHPRWNPGLDGNDNDGIGCESP